MISTINLKRLKIIWLCRVLAQRVGPMLRRAQSFVAGHGLSSRGTRAQ